MLKTMDSMKEFGFMKTKYALVTEADIKWWQDLYKKSIPAELLSWFERASDDFFEAQAAILDFMERNSGNEQSSNN